MQWRSVLSLGVVLTLAAGCASSGSSSAAAAGTSDPDIITLDQIVRSKATNAYDLIASLRPQMFTAHGAPTTRGQQPVTPGRQAMPVVVYIDNVRVGPIAELKSLAMLDIREIRYLSPRVATDRWGENHAGGVISVTTAQATGPDTLQVRYAIAAMRLADHRAISSHASQLPHSQSGENASPKYSRM